jgi:uncharacterized protein (DUF433 family)
VSNIVSFPGGQVVERNTRWRGFYSVQAVSRLTTIPVRTLNEWRQRGIITPSVEMLEEGRSVAEGYSYADLTIIRLIRAFRDDRIDFASAGRALAHLYDRFGPPNQGWADARIYFVGDQIFAERPEEWMTEATHLGQGTMPELFGEMFPELRLLEAGADILVPEEYRAFVEISPEVMGGTPVIRGSRIPTSLLVALRQKGKSVSAISKAYPYTPLRLIKGALAYEDYLERSAA